MKPAETICEILDEENSCRKLVAGRAECLSLYLVEYRSLLLICLQAREEHLGIEKVIRDTDCRVQAHAAR